MADCVYRHQLVCGRGEGLLDMTDSQLCISIARWLEVETGTDYTIYNGTSFTD